MLNRHSSRHLAWERCNMMNSLLKLLIVTIGWSALSVQAQELTVKSFALETSNNIAVSRPRYDLNDEIAAAVIFVAPEGMHLEFRGNVIGNSIREDGLHVAYLANKTKRVHVYATGQLPIEIDFTQYADSQKGVLGGKTYRMSLTLPEKKKDYGTGSNTLIFQADANLRKIWVNGEEWTVTGNTAKRLVPFGAYHYRALADSCDKAVVGDVEVVKMLGNKIVKLKFKE